MKSNITMADIAREAGVSRQCVSQVLNGSRFYSNENPTRLKVLEIAERLRYRPNQSARSLRTGKTNMIGVTSMRGTLLTFRNQYTAAVYEGIGSYYNDTDYNLIYQSIAKMSDSGQGIEIISDRQVDGFIVLLFSSDIDRFKATGISWLRETGLPFVVIHSFAEDLDVPAIGVDFYQGGYRATRHLLEHGYKSIGFVRCEKFIKHGDDLYRGYCRALKEADIPVEPRYEYRTIWMDTQDGYRLADRMLSEKQELPRALLAIEEKVAFGMITRFREVGVRVPEDVAFIGLGGIREDGINLTGLTTIDQQAIKKGHEAAALLDRLIRQETVNRGDRFQVLDPELTRRTSCGCREHTLANTASWVTPQ